MKTKLLAVLLLSLTAASNAFAALPKFPTTGSCAFLITQPVPLGADVTALGETGYNFLGVINFTNATTGTLSGYVVNPIYQTTNSPTLGNPGRITNASVKIAPMTINNGFVGGYTLTVLGTFIQNGIIVPFSLVLNAVSVNAGNVLLLQMAGAAGTTTGPGSGSCEF